MPAFDFVSPTFCYAFPPSSASNKLSTQVCKWVPTNLMLRVALIQREVEIFLVASCYRNQNKLWPDGPLGSNADLTYMYIELEYKLTY